MFRVMCKHVCNTLLPRTSPTVPAIMHIPRANVAKEPMDHHESMDEFVERMECYFNRPEIDGWELRKGLNELAGLDLIPEPQVVLAALCACRRCNDYAASTRLLEMVKFKCGENAASTYPYILQQVRPALKELGISTPEKMGYGEPELWLEDFYDMKYVPKMPCM